MNYIERALNQSFLRSWVEDRTSGRLRVLVYHEVWDPIQFERQMTWLNERFDILSLSDLRQLIGKQNQWDHPLLITFDDARPSIYKHGLPVLKRLAIPSIVFVITSLVGTDQPYWWDEVAHYLEKGEKKMLKRLKTMPDEDRRDYLHSMRASQEGKRLTFHQLDWPKLREMEDAGMGVANHTHTHPMLDNCDSPAIRREVARAAEILEDQGMGGPDILAYPNGNFDERVIREVSQAGIELGFGFDHRMNRYPLNPMKISRLSVRSTSSLDKLQLICSGVHSYILPWRKSLASLTGW